MTNTLIFINFRMGKLSLFDVWKILKYWKEKQQMNNVMKTKILEMKGRSYR